MTTPAQLAKKLIRLAYANPEIRSEALQALASMGVRAATPKYLDKHKGDKKTAARDTLIPLVVRPFKVYGGTGLTDMEWPTKYLGKPSPASIQKYVKKFNEDLEVGGVNSHLGRKSAIYGAEVRDQRKGGIVVAKWEDHSIIQFYKNKPAFEVVGSDDVKTRLVKKLVRLAHANPEKRPEILAALLDLVGSEV